MTKNIGIGFYAGLPLTDPDALQYVDLPMPTAGPMDLVVAVQAVSVNPIDTKLRVNISESEEPTIQGYDATGTIVATGHQVTAFTWATGCSTPVQPRAPVPISVTTWWMRASRPKRRRS